MNKFNPITELKLQPGSRFVTRRSGFDEGTRTFVCDVADIVRLEPKINSQDHIYKRMYVENVQTEEIGAELARMTVSYLGLKNARATSKAAQYEVSYSLEQISADGTSEGIQFRDARFDRVLPSVTATYVTAVAPDQSDLNSKKAPARWNSFVKQPFFAAITSGMVNIFQGWMLTGRSIREAGPLYEVRDIYTYVVHEGRRVS